MNLYTACIPSWCIDKLNDKLHVIQYLLVWFNKFLNIVSFSCSTVPWASVHTSSSIGGRGNILKNIKNIISTQHVICVSYFIPSHKGRSLAWHSIKNKCQDSTGILDLSMVHPWNPCWQNHLFSDIQTTPHFPHQQTATNKTSKDSKKKMWWILTHPHPLKEKR